MIKNLNAIYCTDDNKTRLDTYPDNLLEFGKLCTIRSGENLIPFSLYDYQEELAKIIDTHRFTQIFKTRQVGATETGGLRAFHKACKDPAYAGVFLSIGQNESSNINKRIKLLNSSLGVKWQIENNTELQPSGGGNIKSRPSTDNAARGLESIHDIFIDEAAFIDNIDELYASSLPSQEMVSNPHTIICSTMSEEGEISWFWRLFDANNGDIDAREVIEAVKDGTLPGFFWWTDTNGWAKVLIHWKAHPIYSQNPNYLQEIKDKYQIPEAKVEREFNLGIPKAGGLLFDISLIEMCNYGSWEPAFKNRDYVFTIDPNFGGEDYFCLLVWDVTEFLEKGIIYLVHEFAEHNQSVVNYCLPHVERLYGNYHPCVIAIENNGGGTVIAELLTESCDEAHVEEVTSTKIKKKVYTDRLAFQWESFYYIVPRDWKGLGEMKNFSMLEREATKGHDDRITSWMCLAAVIPDLDQHIGNNGGMSELGG